MFALIAARAWKPLLLLVLVAGAFIYRAVLIHERDAARAQLTTITAQAAQLKAADDACIAAVAQQNAAVEKLRSDEDLAIRAANAREANVSAQAEAAANEAKSAADALAQAKIGKGCAAAIQWANQQAASLGKW
jgi:hypothetical protein